MTANELRAWGNDLAHRFNAAIPASDPDDDVRTGCFAFAHNVRPESASLQLRRLKALNEGLMVEIGTGKGTGTALLAQCARRVLTVDIGWYALRQDIWEWAGVERRITHVLVPDDAHKVRLLHGMDIRTAFIDGDHSLQGVKADIAATYSATVRLFHDYTPPYENGVQQYVDALDESSVIKDPPYAWWCSYGSTLEMLRSVT